MWIITKFGSDGTHSSFVPILRTCSDDLCQWYYDLFYSDVHLCRLSTLLLWVINAWIANDSSLGFENSLCQHLLGEAAWSSTLDGGSYKLLQRYYATSAGLYSTANFANLAKVPVFRCQKMALPSPKQKNRDHFLTPTSPQNDVEHVCFMHLALLGGFYGNFEIWFFYVPFPPLKWPNRLGCKKKYLHGKERS